MRRSLRSLQVRIPLLAMTILAASLASATVIAYELLLLAGRADLDARLRAEQDRFARSILGIASEIAAEDDGAAIGARTLRRAVGRYLSLDPSDPSFMIIVRMGGEVLSSRGGPPEMVTLRDQGALPAPTPGALETLRTPVGDIRSLGARVRIDGKTVALFQVAGPLRPIEAESLRALRRLGIAALVSLPLGGMVLAVVLRRSLAPLGNLAAAARSVRLEDLAVRVATPEGPEEVAVMASEFNRMLERLEEAARHQREFLAAVSHELRTPLTIARGHIETLAAAAKQGPEAVAEATAVAQRELLRMTRLIDDLMALARSRTEDLVRPQVIDLRELFRELGLRLTGLDVGDVTMHEPPPTPFVADAERLAQALLNLVVNAHIHNPPGTRIEVGSVLEHGQLRLSVRDDGRGIDPSIVERAFEPFTKGGDTGAQGLGLAVVRAVAEAHGGGVELDTGPRGTTVTIWIPAVTRVPAASAAGAGKAAAAAPPQ
jgi:two-component system OmpR family sensor kinase